MARLKAAARQSAAAERLTAVKVPEQFQAPFLRAQQYVEKYFANRVEQPDTATISIAGERYVLLRAASLSVEFVELVMKLYQDKGQEEARGVANNLLFDLAHALGKADARSFQQKMGVSDPIDNLSAGPIHFAFSGWAFVDISARSAPSPDENYFLLYDHPYSFESHSWLAKGKRSDIPVCIMNAGYSSGWCEESFGLPSGGRGSRMPGRGRRALPFHHGPALTHRGALGALRRGTRGGGGHSGPWPPCRRAGVLPA